ncbi:MAG: sugar phosphate nucleotidyltransferase [Phycisphaerales bacterium JB059]
MKGVLLAGGRGTRLNALSAGGNKHLVPLAGRPMIDYAIDTLLEAGLSDITLVTGDEHAPAMRRHLEQRPLPAHAAIHLARQPSPAGVADALLHAEPFVRDHPLCVLLADNLLEHAIQPHAEAFLRDPRGAMILLTESTQPQRFAVATFEDADRDRAITDLTEKPTNPTSNAAVIGLYFYDTRVFDLARDLSPSARDELEITDLNLAYLRRGELRHAFIDGWWVDAGDPESFHRAEERLTEGRHP